jgi:hypothetical protein
LCDRRQNNTCRRHDGRPIIVVWASLEFRQIRANTHSKSAFEGSAQVTCRNADPFGQTRHAIFQQIIAIIVLQQGQRANDNFLALSDECWVVWLAAFTCRESCVPRCSDVVEVTHVRSSRKPRIAGWTTEDLGRCDAIDERPVSLEVARFDCPPSSAVAGERGSSYVWIHCNGRDVSVDISDRSLAPERTCSDGSTLAGRLRIQSRCATNTSMTSRSDKNTV